MLTMVVMVNIWALIPKKYRDNNVVNFSTALVTLSSYLAGVTACKKPKTNPSSFKKKNKIKVTANNPKITLVANETMEPKNRPI